MNYQALFFFIFAAPALITALALLCHAMRDRKAEQAKWERQQRLTRAYARATQGARIAAAKRRATTH